MAFRNPILAGSVLVRAAIQSSNYAAGSAGWQISRSGAAEFNNVTIRGGQVVGGTALYYSGTPAAGNLIASVAAAAGTDAYGNKFLAGVASYTSTSFAQVNNGQFLCGAMISGSPDVNDAGGIITSSGGGVLDVFGSATTTGTTTNAPNLQFQAGDLSQATGSATAPFLSLTDALASSDVDLKLSGSLVKLNRSGVPYTWQTPTYNTNWLAGTTFNGNTSYQALEYRLDAENNLHIVGAFKAGATAPVNPVFTLPVGYRPAASMPVWAQRNNAGTITSGHLYVGSSGNVSVTGSSSLGIAAGNEYVCGGVIPLNNIP